MRHRWDVTPEEAMEIQKQLRRKVVTHDEIGRLQFVGGADMAFRSGSNFATAAVALVSFPELELCEYAIARAPVQFPYVPGLLSFRETPPILEALAKLPRLPDLLLCDGHGYAHPRRFGMACHVGVLTGIPSIGVAKTLLVGTHGKLPVARGSWLPLLDQKEIIGAAVRTKAGVKQIYVSIGTGISLETAIDRVLQCSRFRVPEPLRRADHLAEKHKT